MTRHELKQIAEETVAIIERGSYVAPSGRTVDLSAHIQAAVDGTVLYSSEAPPPWRQGTRGSTRITVTNETNCSALARLATLGDGHLACLNFASARQPGGGFLTGAQAQEESLARASALYRCLLAQPEYYERQRACTSALYLDLAMFSPGVPFFRDDAGALLEEPFLASVITAAAPNAGAVARNQWADLDLVPVTLGQRAELVLEVAVRHEVKQLVLGAWGCGVFRNDPRQVAGV
ncbi:MAG: TIGR02452 family protein, partial [Verrucomicrobia bacterium]|nr:TIGR02452 family protein [Verrucomicrobiota bacterium]